jgi:3-oxoacyl-[acyl-carrier protein] reductase
VIALVTGASRGIGRESALRLAADGHEIAVGYGRDREAAQGLAAELPTRAIAVGGDLGEPETAERLVDETEAALGPVGILFADAGVNTPPRRLEEIDLDEWNRIQEVHLRAPFLLGRRVLPGMIERGFGRIVLLSSVAASTGAHYGYLTNQSILLDGGWHPT